MFAVLPFHDLEQHDFGFDRHCATTRLIPVSVCLQQRWPVFIRAPRRIRVPRGTVQRHSVRQLERMEPRAMPGPIFRGAHKSSLKNLRCQPTQGSWSQRSPVAERFACSALECSASMREVFQQAHKGDACLDRCGSWLQDDHWTRQGRLQIYQKGPHPSAAGCLRRGHIRSGSRYWGAALSMQLHQRITFWQPWRYPNLL
jgi:hypothetical protein